MKLAFTLVVSLCCAASFGAVIEVAKNGPISSIQAGIDTAAAGDVVVVKPGVFFERVVVPAGKNGLRIKAKAGAILDGFDPNGGPALAVASDDVEILGLTIKNAFSFNDPGDGIEVSGDRPRIRKCRFVTCEFRSIRTTGADPKIDDCAFFGANVGIKIEGSGVATIEDSKFDLCLTGIQLDAAGSAILQRCKFTNVSGKGIVGDVTGSVDLRNCAFKDVALICVELAVGGNATLRKNSIDGALRAFELESAVATVTGNTIRRIFEDTDAVIDVDVGTCDIRDNSILDCNATAIRVGPAVSGTIADNSIQRCGSIGSAGILVESAAGVTVVDNTLSRLGGDGVRIVLGNGGTIVVDDNTIKDCARDGIDVGAAANAAIVTNNVVRRCFAEGIENSGSSTTIADNDAKQCRLDLANDGTATFTDNAFTTGGENVAPEID